MITFTDAVHATYPKKSYAWDGVDRNSLTITGIENIDFDLIDAKLAELQAEYDSKQYQRDRQYPDLGEQFDLLFKDINEGTLDKTGGFYTAIKAVKDAHPKPE